MVVVPALAMFSHHLPPQALQRLRDGLWRPLVDMVGSAAKAPTATAAEMPPAASVDSPVVAVEPAAAPTAPPVGASGAGGGLETLPAGTRTTAERLARLGATAIECRPLPGDAGTFRAVCHVAIDPAGQLQRVFQAVGRDPAAALERLLDDVEPWRRGAMPTAGRPPR